MLKRKKSFCDVEEFYLSLNLQKLKLSFQTLLAYFFVYYGLHIFQSQVRSRQVNRALNLANTKRQNDKVSD